MNKKKIILFFILSLNLVVSGLAADVDIDVQVDKTTLNLVHNERDEVNLQITNKNLVCSIDCSYKKDSVVLGNTGTIETSAGKSVSFNFIAPAKGVGSTDHTIFVTCNEIDSLLCSPDQSAEWTGLIKINYDLTNEEKAAKAYLESELPNIADSLTVVSLAINTFQNRLDNLPSNIKLDGVHSTFSNLNSRFDSFKSIYDISNSNYQNEDYLNAKSKLSALSKGAILALSEQINVLLTNIENILTKHNQVISSIDTFSQNLESFPTKLASFLKKSSEIKQIEVDFNTLVGEFNSGEFSSYQDVSSQLNALESELDSKQESYHNSVTSIIDKGVSLIKEEYNKLCREAGLCNLDNSVDVGTTREVEDVDIICSKINEGLVPIFDQINNGATE